MTRMTATGADAARAGGGAGLVLDAVAVELPDRPLISGLDLAVRPGEIVTLMGASGSGKSSLLAYLCGTLGGGLRASGRVLLDGREITRLAPERRAVGILFQDDLLFPHMSVGENLAFAVPRGLPGLERTRRVAAALEEADLAGFERRDPATLSGGQRARAALMRTLLAEPRALLLDEPFSRLDGPMRARIRRFVFDHARAAGLPTLLVTHDEEDAVAAAGRRLLLSAGPSGDPAEAAVTATGDRRLARRPPRR